MTKRNWHAETAACIAEHMELVPLSVMQPSAEVLAVPAVDGADQACAALWLCYPDTSTCSNVP